MSEYQLAPEAQHDLDELLDYVQGSRGEEIADALEVQLLEAFRRLARTPGLGHLRKDLTSAHYHFYLLRPYLIVYARSTDPLAILRILHSARNLRRLLSTRRP